VSEKIDQARELALQTPAKICQIFIALGYISADTLVQIVIKEGSRPPVDGSEIEKISFHFITNLYGTVDQMRTLAKAFFQYLEKHAGTLSSVLASSDARIDKIDAMNGYESLIGVDMHPYSNPEQGLAMGFSRKHLRNPYTRFVEILHIRYHSPSEFAGAVLVSMWGSNSLCVCRNGVEILSEIPCGSIWLGRMMSAKPPMDIWYCSSWLMLCTYPLKPNPYTLNSTLDPTKILWALLDASICIPGPRCIGILASTSRKTGFIDKKVCFEPTGLCL
jgi:hypothetical protein